MSADDSGDLPFFWPAVSPTVWRALGWYRGCQHQSGSQALAPVTPAGFGTSGRLASAALVLDVGSDLQGDTWLGQAGLPRGTGTEP